MMKKTLLFLAVAFVLMLDVGCTQPVGDKNKPQAKDSKSEIIHLTKAEFLTTVFNYEKEKDWKYNGNMPAIVDFYADWCGPCRMLAPVLEELQKEYGGKIQIYKVDTQKERQLSADLGIQSLPTVLFIPNDGQPQAMLGFRSKEDIKKIIEEFLKVK